MLTPPQTRLARSAWTRGQREIQLPSGKRTRERRGPRWQAIAGTLVPDFGLRTAAAKLDASLWLAAHDDYKLRVLTGLRAQLLVGDDQGRSWRRYFCDTVQC